MAETTPDAIDHEIRVALATGEYRRVLELLAGTYLDTVYRYCFRMLRADAGHARDVTQQVFEEACKGITTYRGEASAKTWLLAIARNLCRKDIATRERHSTMLRGQQSIVAVHVHTPPPLKAEAVLLSQEGLARLQWALEQLDPAERSLLVMRFGIGVSHELSAVEIAQILGISRATAHRKLQEALTQLRRMMDHDAG
jgi:RNA polymerase sigma factor (sigma-70 family)